MQAFELQSESLAHGSPSSRLEATQALPTQTEPLAQPPQSRVPPQPLGMLPHCAPAAEQVVGTQPQSVSAGAVQPAGQQPSPGVQVETWVVEQAAVQVDTLPVSVSTVQALPSLQLDGQLPSQVSPVSTTPLPQVFEQSESTAELQPAGQQPSPPAHWVIAWCVQTRLQVAADPVEPSRVQESASAQVDGQLPSHSSPASTTPLPQKGWQSVSVLALQPGAQQPSALRHWVMATFEQTRLQLEAEPLTTVSAVQATPSLQPARQLPSQVSPGSTTVLPQTAGQSASETLVQPAGQQPSAAPQLVVAVWVQAAVQFAALPVRVSVVQAMPSLQLDGQLPSQLSPASTAPLPQLAEQSESLSALQPGAQQPSALRQAVIGWWVQARLQSAAEPVPLSAVQALPSSQAGRQ
jgi:hypothetical protein